LTTQKLTDLLPLNRPRYNGKNDLGDRIREYRRVHGLSQKKLADLLAVDQTTLAAWERKEHQPTRRLLNMLISLVTSLPPSVSMLK